MNTEELIRKITRLEKEIRSLSLRADILHRDIHNILAQSFRPGAEGARAKNVRNGRTIQHPG